MIRKATASQASHSFLIYLSAQFQQHMVLEVQGRGFVQVPYSVWKTHNKLLALYKIDRGDTVIELAMHKLGERLGDPYDTVSLIGLMLIYVMGVWDRNDLDDKKKLVCSEMVALFLRWANIPIQTHIDRVVPQDLWRLAEETPAIFDKQFTSAKAERKLAKVCKKGKVLLDPSNSTPDELQM